MFAFEGQPSDEGVTLCHNCGQLAGVWEPGAPAFTIDIPERTTCTDVVETFTVDGCICAIDVRVLLCNNPWQLSKEAGFTVSSVDTVPVE